MPISNCHECPFYEGLTPRYGYPHSQYVLCKHDEENGKALAGTGFNPELHIADRCPLSTQFRTTRFYVASSWRNDLQPSVVAALAEAGHAVYDFRNPAEDNPGFGFHRIDPDWQQWPAKKFREMLAHPSATKGFKHDLAGMKNADAFVLVLPCGRSAHLEAGWAIGKGLPVAILLDDASEPELLYKLATRLVVNMDELLEWADKV